MAGTGNRARSDGKRNGDSYIFLDSDAAFPTLTILHTKRTFLAKINRVT